jgi:hypothetical protein
MSQAPSLIFDKSSLESLNLDEAHPRRLDWCHGFCWPDECFRQQWSRADAIE